MMRVHSFHMYTMMCSVCYTTVQISTRRPGRRFELRSVWMQLFDARMERWTTMLQIDALYRRFLVVSAYRSRLSSIAKAFVRRRRAILDSSCIQGGSKSLRLTNRRLEHRTRTSSSIYKQNEFDNEIDPLSKIYNLQCELHAVRSAALERLS